MGLLLGSTMSETLEEEVLLMLMQSTIYSKDGKRPYGSSTPSPQEMVMTPVVFVTQ
jgi:hypothetical protein